MGCIWSKRRPHLHEDTALLAEQTRFSEWEVKALHELFRKLSSSIVDDGVISKEEFQLGLFRDRKKENLFADRIFNVFDIERKGAIGFGEFVRSLSIFHPDSAEAEKVAFAFQLYDIRQTGFIEREEVTAMLKALLDESNIILPDDIIEAIIDKTFAEADTKCDGKIDKDEWKEFVARNPSLMRNMTIPYLKDLSNSFPSFEQRSEMGDEESDDLACKSIQCRNQ